MYHGLIPELIVERNNLRLPLENYGTGIHQLIILAIAVLEREDALVGIEEPEIHLHPLLGEFRAVMTWSDIGVLAELLGAIGVIASLII